MKGPAWLVIAVNEYRIRINRVPSLKPYFPYLAPLFLVIHALFVAPLLADLFAGGFLGLMVSRSALSFVGIILFVIFLYFIILPVTHTLRDLDAGGFEHYLSAPVKPSHLLLGEFLGEMPFYSLIVGVLAALFAAALRPLGLGRVQLGVVVLVFVMVFMSSSWIGNLVAAFLRSKVRRSGRGRDIGRAVSFILPLPLVFLVYAIQFGGLLEALSDPATKGWVRTLLGALPSSWGARTITAIARNPGQLMAAPYVTFGPFLALFLFLAGSLWLGVKLSDWAYKVEPGSLSPSMAGAEGRLSRAVRLLAAGGSLGVILLGLLRIYFRRLENVSKITYIGGLTVFLSIFLGGPENGEFGVLVPLMAVHFMLPMFTVFVVGGVTIRGKDMLMVYRKAPGGVARFIEASLVEKLLVVAPLGMVVGVASVVVNADARLSSTLPNLALLVPFSVAAVAFVLGLFLANPAFSERSGKFILNLFLAMTIYGILLVVSLAGVVGTIEGGDPWRGMLELQMVYTVTTSLVAVLALYAGWSRFSAVE